MAATTCSANVRCCDSGKWFLDHLGTAICRELLDQSLLPGLRRGQLPHFIGSKSPLGIAWGCFGRGLPVRSTVGGRGARGSCCRIGGTGCRAGGHSITIPRVKLLPAGSGGGGGEEDGGGSDCNGRGGGGDDGGGRCGSGDVGTACARTGTCWPWGGLQWCQKFKRRRGQWSVWDCCKVLIREGWEGRRGGRTLFHVFLIGIVRQACCIAAACTQGSEGAGGARRWPPDPGHPCGHLQYVSCVCLGGKHGGHWPRRQCSL